MAFNDDQWSWFLARPGAKSTDPEFNSRRVKVNIPKPHPAPPGSDKPLTSPDVLLGHLKVEPPTAHDFKIHFPTDNLKDLKKAFAAAGAAASQTASSFDDFVALLSGKSPASTTAMTSGVPKDEAAFDLEKMQEAMKYLASDDGKSPTSPFAHGGFIMSTPRHAGKSLFDDLTFDDLMLNKPSAGRMKGLDARRVWIDEAGAIINEKSDTNEEDMKSEVTEEMKAELEKLAKEMTDGIQAMPQDRLPLLAPEALTVLGSKGYSKKSHIGGEEFIPQSVYLGKKGALIACFKPADVSDYGMMEMPVEDALRKLSGFDAVAQASCERGYKSRITELRSAIVQRREAQEIAEKADVYADIGFGTW